jgi:hypothetical protein
MAQSVDEVAGHGLRKRGTILNRDSSFRTLEQILDICPLLLSPYWQLSMVTRPEQETYRVSPSAGILT